MTDATSLPEEFALLQREPSLTDRSAFCPGQGFPGYVPSSGGISAILVDVVQVAASRMLLARKASAARSSVNVR